jgi:hypothetical protein
MSPVSETSAVYKYWTQLSRIHMKTESESSLEMCFKMNDRMLDDVHNCDRYINISVPSSQTYRPYKSCYLTFAYLFMYVCTSD